MNKDVKLIRIQDTLHERLSALIVKTGQTLTFVGNQAIREYLDREEKKHGKAL